MARPIKDILRHQVRKYPYLRYYVKKVQRKLEGVNSDKTYFFKALQYLDETDLSYPQKKHEKPENSLIEITNACNLNCLMCNTKLSERPPSLMTTETFERIVKELKSVGIYTAGLHTVGETFVYRDLETLFSIAERHDFRPWISTNAQFPERIEPLYRLFPKSFGDIRISIDGAEQETFEHIRVGGSFDKVIKTLEVIHRLNNGKNFFRIGVTIDSVLNMTTVYEIALFFKKFKKYAYHEHINFLVITGLSPDDTYFKETFPFKYLIRHAAPCHMPFTNQYFTYDGQGTMCCRDYNGELTTGDIMSTSILEIWNGSQAEKIRQQHLSPESLEVNACKNCFGLHDFVGPITNHFIHFVRLRMENISDDGFAVAVIALWEGMNDAMKTKDLAKLRSFVCKAFDAVSADEPLKPIKVYSRPSATIQTVDTKTPF